MSGSQAPVELIIRARITSPAAPLKVKQLIAPALATLTTLVVPKAAAVHPVGVGNFSSTIR